jgi:hypothetical protein
MKSLSKNWFVEDLIDFEYKKYILLAYLQRVKGSFSGYRLYPYLSDLVEQYRNLSTFVHARDELVENFPKSLKEVDAENLRLIYENLCGKERLMAEIESIVAYSLPKIRDYLDAGKDLYEKVEHQLLIHPVGILPLYKDEGYMLLKMNENRETRVYRYQITLFEGAEENFRGIHTFFVDSYRNSLINTFEGIKRHLTQENSQLPNPATYLIESEKQYPFDETLLPVASRMLVRYIFKAQG